MSGRPRIVANFALSADGKVSTRNQTPTTFTSAEDKRRLRALRANGDAVMVGAGTARADTMSLGLSSPSLRAARRAAGKPSEPLRVIVSNSGRLDTAGKAFRHRGSPLVIFSTTRMPARIRDAAAPLADLWLFENTVSLPAALAILRHDYGVRTLICEGGPTLFRALVELGCVDELRLTWTPFLFGGHNAPTLLGPPGPFLPRRVPAKLVNFDPVGNECFLTYRMGKQKM